MNLLQVYICPPHLEPPLQLPPHSIPLGCPRASALGALPHASNLHWPSVLHMVMYMCQCYSLESSHLCLLPLSPKVCSLHQCFLCCLTCRMIGTIFLNSIYITRVGGAWWVAVYGVAQSRTRLKRQQQQQHTVFVLLFLTYFTLYNRLQVHPPH